MIVEPQINAEAGATAPAAPKKPVVVMLNESIDFATVHGDRGPGDREYAVAYVQGGLPFDPQKRLIQNHHTILESEALQAKMAKLVRKAEKLLENLAQREADSEDAEDEDRDESEDER